MITRTDIWLRVADSFWSNLAIGIVYRACMDYEDRLVALYFEKDPVKKRARRGDFKEVRDFFGSDWYYILTSIDHRKMLRALNERAKDRIKTKQIHRKYQTLWCGWK